MTDTMSTTPQAAGKAGGGVPTLGEFLAQHGIDVTAPVHSYITTPKTSTKDLLKGYTPFGAPADGPPAPAKTVTKEVPKKFNLSTALAQYVKPYLAQLDQASGVGANGKATAASEIPGLAGYLANMTPQEQATIAPYLQQQATEASKLPGILNTSIKDAGNAGLLSDLLNAAKYQAIYKQANYAPSPPSDTPLGQLYAAVVAGGNQLAGGSALPTGTQSLTGSTNTNASSKSGVSPLNPYNINGTPQS